MKYHLIDVICKNSESNSWEDAVKEWDIVGFDVDEDCSSKCVCGKEDIKYLFKIQNHLNNVILDPIGSKCIKKFCRKDLSDEVDVCEQIAKLLDKVSNNQFVEFTSDLFSRKLLKYLYENGCFQASSYNRYDPYNDYKFLLEMFNQRKEPTDRQRNKITALIMSSIKPFCREVLNRMKY